MGNCFLTPEEKLITILKKRETSIAMMKQKYLVVKYLRHDQQESASRGEGVRECEGNVLAYRIPLSAKNSNKLDYTSNS